MLKLSKMAQLFSEPDDTALSALQNALRPGGAVGDAACSQRVQGLDVCEEEAGCFHEDLSDSVIADDALARLTTFSNVMVAGHQGSLTDVAQSSIAETTIENVREYETGKRGGELTNAVAFKSS